MSRERWQKIDDIFNNAVVLSKQDRSAYLDVACSGNDELRAVIEGMLKGDERSLTILDASRDELATLLPEENTTFPENIGPYRVLNEIARGGMGTVYLAVRADGQFEMQVALKLVKRGMDSDEILRRFRYERQILANLDHPNIARLYDGGLSEDGRPYLAMEYVDGISLDRYCDQNKLSVKERLRLFETVCGAVQYAHNNLVVHRDLKPSNILVTENADVKLLDFGIAKLLEEDGIDYSTPMTRKGVRVMTPEYASPEQILEEKITTSSDVYTLGLILYELLTGRRPFVNRDAKSGSTLQVSEQQVERPSVAVTKSMSENNGDGAAPNSICEARSTTIDRLRQSLRGDLDTIVLKALRREPERRYVSADAFVEDVKRYLTGLPVAARPDTFTYRARKFVLRHKFGVVVAIAFSVLILGFAISTALQAKRIDAERRVAEDVSSFMEDLFAGADPFSDQAVQIDTLRIRDFLQRGVVRVEQDLRDQPELQSRLLTVLGRVHYKIGHYDQATDLLLKGLDGSRRLYKTNDPRIAEIAQTLGGLYEETGDYSSAESYYREALDIALVNNDRNHPDVASAMSQLGYLFRVTGDLEQAELLIREAIRISRNQADEPDIAFANSLTRFGILLQEKGDIRAAEDVHQEALDVRRQLFQPGHSRLATSILNVAFVRMQLGDYDSADSLSKESLQIAILSAREAPHIKVAQALKVVGELRAKMGDLSQSKSSLEEAVEMFAVLVGDSTRQTASARIALGTTLNKMGSYDEALASFVTASETVELRLGLRHSMLVEAWTGIAESLRLQDQLVPADSIARRAVSLADDLQRSHQRTAFARLVLARISDDTGELGQARRLYEEARDILAQSFPTDHPEILVINQQIERLKETTLS